MKKAEAKALAPAKSKLIIEYMTQILSYPEKVEAKIDLGVVKMEKQLVCVADIYAPKMQLEKQLNLEITMDHSLVLCRQLLSDLLATFLDYETIQMSHSYSLKSMIENFIGIDITNHNGSRIHVNFNESGTEFYEMLDNYDKTCDAFAKQESHQKVK